MPERKKERKTKNVTEETQGGAEVFLPMKKRHRKTKFPKGYDPAQPGPPLDPERWLPKWQRSKYKKMAKKRGIVLKGAQGDAAMDTDVTNTYNKEQSTAHKEVADAGNNKKKNKKRGR
jgi:signal recognition particle subunit SRP72